jgi:Ca2+-binding EF-hand superfamily protein
MAIVFVWISSGTLFYSFCNKWPLSQSFFYAVDAGMSIGFCTDVYEIKLISKAFTIIYILLGASVIGGALALFIQDAVEGLATPAITEYQLLLEKDAFETANVSRTGVLSYEEFRQLIETVMMKSSTTSTSSSSSSSKRKKSLSERQRQRRKDNSSVQLKKSLTTEEDILLLWNKFDRLKDGVIHFEEFTGTFRGVERLVKSLKEQEQSRIINPLRRMVYGIRSFLQEAWQLEHRIYFVFVLWVSMGILWGILDQGWDPITATHFAVSALATGGLTAPDVNADGILPTEPAIFCGVFCLFGIPLFALTLGHYARYLVSGHVAALEQSALTRPITRVEFDFAKRLTTPQDPLVHLSDFIVLQLLRQGKISMEAISVMKQNFDLLDVDNNRSLSFEELSASAPDPDGEMT